VGAVEHFGKETWMCKLIHRFRWDEDGAALIEYGMLIGLIAVICFVAVTTIGTEISTAFSRYAVGLASI
jgi:pilus assembly protein Flp/PilA